MMEQFKSRKFILAVVTVVVSSGLVYVGAIADVVYATIVSTTVGAYIAGNVTQKATQK